MDAYRATRNFFSSDLNFDKVLEDFSESGKLFQRLGAKHKTDLLVNTIRLDSE